MEVSGAVGGDIRGGNRERQLSSLEAHRLTMTEELQDHRITMTEERSRSRQIVK